MLMALLPLAGWAEPITPAMFSVTDVPYGTNPVVSSATLTVTTHYTVDETYYADDNGTAIPATKISKSGHLSIGTYYVKITGAGTYSGTIYKPFVVSAKELEISFNGCAKTWNGQSVTDADLAGGAKVYDHTYTVGKAPLEKISGSYQNDDDPMDNAKYGVTGTESDVKRNATTQAVEGYAYSCTSKDPNYTIKVKDGSGVVTINPKNLPLTTVEGAYAFNVPANANYVYTGSVQGNLPTFDVMDGETPLVAGQDYNVVWWKNSTMADENDIENPKFAITYYAQIVGAGNYGQARAITAGEGAWTITVAKKPIIVYVQPKAKIYNGEAIAITSTGSGAGTEYNITDATIVVNTLASVDADLKNDLKAKFKVDGNNTTAPVNAGSYQMIAYATAGSTITNNYAPTYMEVGSYTINKRKVTVKAVKQSFVYTGSNIATTTGAYDATKINLKPSVTVNEVTVDIEAAQYEATVLKNETGVLTGESVLDKITLTKIGEAVKAVKNYQNVIKVGQTDDDCNYEIVEDNTGDFGDVEVTGKPLMLIAGTFEKPYGYELNFDDLSWLTSDPTVEKLGGTPEYEVLDANNDPVAAGTLLDCDATYTISITNGTSLAPTNYSILPENVFTGTLTITKKALKATVTNQSVALNAAVASGATNTLLQGKDYVTFEGLVGEEIVKYEIYSDQVTTTAGTFNGTITVKLVATTDTKYSNSHYTLPELNITKGNLTVNPANTVVLNRTEADLVNFIKTNKSASAADKKTIKFTARALGDECWNSFVLPFEVSVAKLSQAVGYCLVNVLDKTASKVVDNKAQARFKIEMNTIPANTPFLMKTADAKNMSDVTIADVVLVEAATTPVVNNDNNIKFIPLYTRTLMMENNRFPVNVTENPVDDTQNDHWFSGNGTSSYLNALASYIEVPEGATARIFVEDFENGTTVIKEIGINGSNKAYSVDGWYTLNGVKLQGAPTEKGIYINNGKKVVIK